MEITKDKNKTVYVVFWVDLDDDCLKKSEIEIIGVYEDEKVAKEIEDSYQYRKGYCEDHRCHYCYYVEISLNKLNPWIGPKHYYY